MSRSRKDGRSRGAHSNAPMARQIVVRGLGIVLNTHEQGKDYARTVRRTTSRRITSQAMRAENVEDVA